MLFLTGSDLIQMNDKHSNQQNDEREIIEKFLQTAGIKIQPNGIQSLKPPFPDILCSLVGDKTIAFELTETVDPKIARTVNFKDSVMIEMRDYMFYNMASSDRSKLEKIFDNAVLYFKFNDGTSKSEFRQLLPALFQTLLMCSFDTKGNIGKKLLPAGVKQIRIGRGAYVGGPMFNASGLALYVADKTTKCISEKFSKRYKCDCPIELLVHSRIHSLPPNTLWLPDVQKLVVQQLSGSPFQRVWIFDYVGSTIRYVYPKSINLAKKNDSCLEVL
jgi:hypothetical protein